MFALLLFPGVQEKLQIIFDDPLDATQVTFSKSAFARNSYRVKPEFGFVSFSDNVNMRRFICHVRLIEEKFEASNAKDNGHERSR